MSLRARKPLIVVFVLGALALGAVMVYFFGGRDKFSRHDSFLVYFDDSINGLVPGSAVKFKGVPIGYVDSIRLDYRQPDDHRIPVRIQLNVDRLQHQLGVLEDLSNPAVLDAQVKRGLRADLDIDSNVTGQMFVDLEYQLPPPPVTPVVLPPGRPAYPVIPSISSEAVADLQQVQDTLSWMSTFDFRREIDKVGEKVDAFATDVSAIPYAQDSLRLQRALRPLVRMNYDAWQRALDNYFARLDSAQAALGDANDNFYLESQDFVAMNQYNRDQLRQLGDNLAAVHAALQADDPAIAHLTHNFQQLAKDMQALAGKLQAAERQPDLLNKAGR